MSRPTSNPFARGRDARARLAAAGAALCLLIVGGTVWSDALTNKAPAPTPPPIPETGALSPRDIGNGVWWRPICNETSVTEVLDNLKEWGYPNLYLETFYNGRTIYPSAHFEKHTTGTRDWLAYISGEAKKRDIRVHASVAALCWHEMDPETGTTNPLIAKNPQWLDLNRDGSPYDGNTGKLMVSPFCGDVCSLLTGLVDEIAKRPVTGINLHCLHFNPAGEFGYNAQAVKLFEAETGVNPLTSEDTELTRQEAAQWAQLHKDALTTLTRLMTERIREAGDKRGVRLLASAVLLPSEDDARVGRSTYQDWRLWLQEGFFDFTTPLCQDSSPRALEKELREMRSAHQAEGLACVPMLQISDEQGAHPALADQRRILEGTGFKFCSVKDYQALQDEMELREEDKSADESRDRDD